MDHPVGRDGPPLSVPLCVRKDGRPAKKKKKRSSWMCNPSFIIGKKSDGEQTRALINKNGRKWEPRAFLVCVLDQKRRGAVFDCHPSTD